MGEVELGTVYELEKQRVQAVEKKLSISKIRDRKNDIKQFICEYQDTYFMLLCRERNDYTIFSFAHGKTKEYLDEFADILIDECIYNRGELRGININNKDGSVEIWVSIDNESYCYHLFPYNLGVIEI